MFCSIVFTFTNDINTEVNVEEDTFTSLLDNIHDNYKVFCNQDEDGCCYYYFVNHCKDCIYIGCSSELFKDLIDVYF